MPVMARRDLLAAMTLAPMLMQQSAKAAGGTFEATRIGISVFTVLHIVAACSDLYLHPPVGSQQQAERLQPVSAFGCCFVSCDNDKQF